MAARKPTAHSTILSLRVCVYLKLVLADDSPRLQVLTDLVEDGEHGDVGFASTGGCADEQVFIGVVSCLEHYRLDSV